jgi:hypothetical protein
MFSRGGIFLFGFLKKKIIKSVAKIPKKVNIFQPMVIKSTARSAAGIINGSPSFATGHLFSVINPFLLQTAEARILAVMESFTT